VTSERETHRWLQDQSGLGELLDSSFEESNLYKMYQVSDQLLKKKSAIEEHLFQKEQNRVNMYLGLGGGFGSDDARSEVKRAIEADKKAAKKEEKS